MFLIWVYNFSDLLFFFKVTQLGHHSAPLRNNSNRIFDNVSYQSELLYLLQISFVLVRKCPWMILRKIFTKIKGSQWQIAWLETIAHVFQWILTNSWHTPHGRRNNTTQTHKFLMNTATLTFSHNASIIWTYASLSHCHRNTPILYIDYYHIFQLWLYTLFYKSVSLAMLLMTVIFLLI